jgi:hypothetical protein
MRVSVGVEGGNPICAATSASEATINHKLVAAKVQASGVDANSIVSLLQHNLSQTLTS